MEKDKKFYIKLSEIERLAFLAFCATFNVKNSNDYKNLTEKIKQLNECGSTTIGTGLFNEYLIALLCVNGAEPYTGKGEIFSYNKRLDEFEYKQNQPICINSVLINVKNPSAFIIKDNVFTFKQISSSYLETKEFEIQRKPIKEFLSGK